MSDAPVPSQPPPSSANFNSQQPHDQPRSQLDPTLTYLCLMCGCQFGTPVPDMWQADQFGFFSTSPTARLLHPYEAWPAQQQSLGEMMHLCRCGKVLMVPPGPWSLASRPSFGPGLETTSSVSSATSNQPPPPALRRLLPKPTTSSSSSSSSSTTPKPKPKSKSKSKPKSKPKPKPAPRRKAAAAAAAAAVPPPRPAVPFLPPSERPSAAPRPPFLSAPQQSSSFGALNSYQWDVEDKIRLADLAIHQGLPMAQVSAMLGRGIPACEEELENIRSGKSALPRRAGPVGLPPPPPPSSGFSAPSPAAQNVPDNRWNTTGAEGSGGPGARREFPPEFFFP